MNKKFSVLIVSVIVAVAIAAITITVIENNSDDSIEANVAPLPDYWTRCAVEGGICSYQNAPFKIRYGSDSSWVSKHFRYYEKPIPCTNAEFGDPAPGATKECYYSAPTPTSTEWVKCAAQGGTCSVLASNSIVKYNGTNDNWLYGVFGSPVKCDNGQWGDPDVGNDKNCYYQGAVPAGPWVPCAIDGGRCNAQGMDLIVAYGPGDGRTALASEYVYDKFSGDSIICDGTQFGDPAPNQVKGCFYQGPLPTDNWKYCVTEGDTCDVPYQTIVKFGADDNWIYGAFNQPFVCDTTTFSDIEPNDKSKLCYYQLN